MRALDYLDPLPVHEPHQPLGHAVGPLRAGVPIALAGDDGWRLIRPVDALAYPLTRQLRDLPSQALPLLDVNGELDLDALVGHEIWGATNSDTLVGRIESSRVLGTLGAMTRRDVDRALMAAARERLMPKLLHDLSNALTIANVSLASSWAATDVDKATEMHSATEEALRHATAMLTHMRTLYTGAPSHAEATIDIVALLANIEPMLRVAARPARLTVEAARGATAYGQRWRYESVLLNMVLNASNLAHAILVRATAPPAGGLTLSVEDDGPGFDDPEAVLAKRESQGAHGHGLPSIRRQVAAIGGQLEIDRSELGGACLRIALPPT